MKKQKRKKEKKKLPYVKTDHPKKRVINLEINDKASNDEYVIIQMF